MLLSNQTDLVRKNSIEELCGHRERALQLYRQALDTLHAAQIAHARAAGGKAHSASDFLRDIHHRSRNGVSFDVSVRKGVDRDMWRYLIDATSLGAVMDKIERDRFEESIKTDPAEVTPDNVFATLSRLAGDANMIFRRGLAEAFRHFCADFKSHDGFKIGKRFVINGLVQGGRSYPHLSHYRDADVRDLDRCMHVLDGKPAPEYQQGVLAALRTAIAVKANEAATEYFRVAIFYGNGNAHFYPLRQDLVDRANKLIAEHYGETLGAGHSARHAS